MLYLGLLHPYLYAMLLHNLCVHALVDYMLVLSLGIKDALAFKRVVAFLCFQTLEQFMNH